MHVRNKNREFHLYICSFAAFFLLCLFFSKPSANKKSGISLSYNCFFAATLFCFPFSFAMRPSFTVVIRQCSANCMQLPSPQLHLTFVLLYHIHVGETIYAALPREYGDNDGATEEQQSRWNLGKVNREQWKIHRSMTFLYAVRKLTHLGGGHRKIVYRHSEMAYIHRRQREAAWHTVT